MLNWAYNGLAWEINFDANQLIVNKIVNMNELPTISSI